MKRSHQSKKEIYILLFAFVAIALLAVISKTVGFYQIETMHRTTSDIYEHPLKVSNAALNVKLKVYKIHRDMKDVVLSSSAKELSTLIKKVNQNETDVYKHLSTIEKNILGDEGYKLQKKTKELFNAWKPIRDEVITLIKNNKRDEAVAITKDKGHKHVIKLEDASQKLYLYAQNKATYFKDESHESFEKLRFINVEISIFLLVFFVLVVYFTIRRTSNYFHRNEHLNDVLSLVRDVNQLIVREKDVEQLLKKSCDILSSSHVYENAWIITFDDTNQISDFVSSDTPENFALFKEKIKKDWTPHCISKTIDTTNHYSSMDDILNNCPECPFVNNNGGKSAFNIELKYENRLYGYLNITIEKEYINDKDEISILDELAGDISYALNNLRIEDILKESNERYRTLFKGNKVTELIIDADSGKITDCNEKALEFYGYTYEQITSMNINEINILSNKEVAHEMEQARKEHSDKFNFRHKLASGDIRDVEVYSGPIEFNNETLLYSVIFDVTEKHQLEQYKTETFERYRFAIEAAVNGIWDWNLITNEVYFSPTLKAILGYNDDEMPNNYEEWESRIHPDDKEKIFSDVETALKNKNTIFKNIHRLKHRDGYWIWIESRAITIFDKDDKPIRMIGSHTDITKEKEYENTIVQIKELYGNIISSVDNLIFVKDTNFNYIACNSAFEDFMGKSKDEIIGKNDYDFFEKEIADFFRGYDKKMVASNEAKSNFEWVTYPDGSQVYLLTTKSPLVDSNGNISGLVGNSVDITEQEHVLERLKESQALARLGSWEYDIEKDELIATEELYNIYSFTDPDIKLDKYTFYKQVHPDDRETAKADFLNLLHSKETNISHYRIIRKSDGETRYLEHRWKTEYKDDVAIKTTGTTQDITEQKQIEQELLENETRFRSIFSQTFQFAGIIDLEGKVISVNNVSLEFIDAKESDLVGKLFIDTPWWEHSKDLREWLTKSIAKASNGETIQGEVTHYSKDGELHYFDFSLKPVVDEEKKVQYLVAESRDITDSKIAEETLAESNRQLLAFMDNLPGMAYRCKNDARWSMEFVSERCLDLTGYKPNDVMNNKKISFLEVIHPEDRDKVWEDVQNGLKKKGNFESEYRITTASGETKWVWEHGLGIYDEDNNVIALEGVIIDNEARKHAEQELIVSNDKFEKAFNKTPNMIIISNLDSGIIYDVNETFEKILGHKREDIIGKSTIDLNMWHKIEDREKFVKNFKKNGSINGDISDINTKDGDIKTVKIFSNIVTIDAQTYILSVVEDLTEKLSLETENKKLIHVLDQNVNEVHVFNLDDYHFTYVNHAGLSALGYTMDEMKELTPANIQNSISTEEEFEVFFEPLLNKREKQLYMETSQIRKDGSKYHVQTILQVITFNNVKQVVATVLDISERIEMQAALNESEKRFRLMMQQSPSVIELYDLDGMQIDVNHSYEVLWGFPATTTLNRFNLFKSEEVKKTGLIDYINQAYAGEHVNVPVYEFDLSGETEGQGKGRKRWLNTVIFPLKDSNNVVKNIVITHEDITAKQDSLKELEEKTKELETIFNEAPDPMAIHDENGNILMINKAWEEKTGYKHKEINTIDKWTKKVAPTTSGDRKEHIKNLYAITEKIDEGEFEITTKSGEKLIWSFSSGPLKTTNDGTRILISSAKDVTELKHKDDLIMMQSRHAAMGEMIGMIAHQWRQPISIISMVANNVLLDIALDSFNVSEAEKFSNSILKQTSHLSKTIDDFRNFFKPDKDVSKVILRNIIEETSNKVNDSLINNNVALITSFESDTEVNAYQRELMQVFVNIINNSKDAMLSNGIKKPIINIKVFDDEKYVNTEICDNGGGIAENILPKIFDPYFTTKDEKTGTGLGLYMSKMIVEDHLHGIIEAHNTKDGACFRVRLLK